MGAHGLRTGSHRSVDMDYSFIPEPQCSRRQLFSWDLAYEPFWRFSLRNRTGKFLDIQARPVNGWCQNISEGELLLPVLPTLTRGWGGADRFSHWVPAIMSVRPHHCCYRKVKSTMQLLMTGRWHPGWGSHDLFLLNSGSHCLTSSLRG